MCFYSINYICHSLQYFPLNVSETNMFSVKLKQMKNELESICTKLMHRIRTICTILMKLANYKPLKTCENRSKSIKTSSMTGRWN